MAERVGAGRATGWTVVNILVVLYALFPVLWILSLSLKPTSTVKDGKLIPSEIVASLTKIIRVVGSFTRACSIESFTLRVLNGERAKAVRPDLLAAVKARVMATDMRFASDRHCCSGCPAPVRESSPRGG